jgi:hypothetical protein
VTLCALAMTTSADATVPAGRYTVSAGSVIDAKTKLVWQQTPAATSYTWAGAKTYCGDIGSSLGGTGWRLPTMKELQTIVDDSRSGPSIDPTAFPASPSGVFWSSSPVAGMPSSAWCVVFSSGYATNVDITNTGNVRCVR